MRAKAFVIVLLLALLSTAVLAEEVATEATRADRARSALVKGSFSKGSKADVPGLISYQGTLTDDAGIALDTTVSVTFTIYDADVGGSVLWTETQPSVGVTDGLFNVLLGEVNSLTASVFSGPDRWLGVQVGGDPELTPRQRIGTVAYAFQAGGDGDWTITGSNMYSAVSGNVGIGTSAPSEKLHIRGSDPVLFLDDNGGGNTYMHFDVAGYNDWEIRTGANGFFMKNKTVGTDYMTITTDGKVGIGTTSPSTNLHVVGDVNSDAHYKLDGYTVLSRDGSDNTLVGTLAGESNTGSRVTLVGHRAGNVNQGSYNTFVGRHSGYSNTTGSPNTFLGYNAGYNNTTADENTFLGYESGYSNTTGYENTFVGHNTGRYNTTGRFNTFLGYESGYSNTTGRENTFVGWHTGVSNTEGNHNTFVGLAAGNQNTTGLSNTFIGWDAGRLNTTGGTNTTLGKSAGWRNTTGSSNTILGANAGYENTTGGANTMVGSASGYECTGSANTYVGYHAGFWNVTGDSNVCLGNRAGYLETGSHRLYIDNSSTNSPLIWGDFQNNRLVINGNNTHNINNRTFFSNGQAGGTTAWYNDSDKSLKQDVRTIPHALERVQRLRGVDFRWRDAERHEPGRQIGFIAQEAMDVLPEVVSGQNGRYAMQYGPITALLVEAMKEQQKIIEDQQNQIEKLTRRLDDLEK
jgi:hypothetical protein